MWYQDLKNKLNFQQFEAALCSISVAYLLEYNALMRVFGIINETTNDPSFTFVNSIRAKLQRL